METCPHEHKTPWQCLLFKKLSSKTHDIPRLSRRSKTKGLSGTLFFFAPVSRLFAPVSRKTLGYFLIISGDIRCKMSISRMSKPIECKALFCVSTEFIVQLCHAAMPQADEFSPWVFSTDSPMHQIASST